MRAPVIWKGQDAQLLVEGTLLKKDGTPVGGAGANAFGIVQCDAGTSPTADSASDTLTFTGGSITTEGTAASDTVTLKKKEHRQLDAEVPVVGTYQFIAWPAFPITITDIKFSTSNSTVDFKLQIDGVDVGGLTGLQATTTPGTATPSGAATVGADGKLTVVVSAVGAAAADFCLSLRGVS